MPDDLKSRTCGAAIAYADLGWCVFPLWSAIDGRCTCGKADCANQGKHPWAKFAPRGFLSAVTDGGAIVQWFGGPMVPNLGLATGPKSGVLVLDVDPRHGGDASLATLEELPATAVVESGGGGWHHYFRYPSGLDIRNSAGRLGSGLDIRGDGGYIIVPPSRHLSGKEYKWLRDPRGGIAELPRSILERLQNDNGRLRNAAPAAEGTIPRGNRHCTMTSLAGTMRRRGMSQGAILAALHEENENRCEGKLPEKELTQIAQSIGSKSPRPAGQGAYHLTDTGNAERIADDYAGSLRYCSDRGQWLRYDGRRWDTETGDNAAMNCAIESARQMLSEAQHFDDSDRRTALAKWALRSETASRLQATLSIAKCLPSLVAYVKDFDKDPYQLNCLNGIVDLRTGELRPHCREEMLTKLAPVSYDPDARLELWDDFLQTVTEGDATIEDFLQTAVGYSVTGDTREDKLFLIHGPGATGKSTFLEAVKATLGDYAVTTDFETFLRRNQAGGARNDIARLAGARFVISIEVEEGRRLAEALVKTITGGDTVTARHLYRDHFEFRPQCKLWLACNDTPRVSDVDTGLWRRILRVPFVHAIPKARQDPALKALLRDPQRAGPAILAWIVQGCLRWRREGLLVPEAVEDATEEYRTEQDPLRDFLEEECVVGPGYYVPVTEFKQRYMEWVKAAGIRYPLRPHEFNHRLEARQCRRQRLRIYNELGTQKQVKCWCDITLAPSPKTLSEEQGQDDLLT